MEGLIPFISISLQAMAFLCFLRIIMSFSFSDGDRREEMMTGRVEFSPRKAYSRLCGSSLSSRGGGSSTDGLFGGSFPRLTTWNTNSCVSDSSSTEDSLMSSSDSSDSSGAGSRRNESSVLVGYFSASLISIEISSFLSAG
jgi:hypothetical protein